MKRLCLEKAQSVCTLAGICPCECAHKIDMVYSCVTGSSNEFRPYSSAAKTHCGRASVPDGQNTTKWHVIDELTLVWVFVHRSLRLVDVTC